MPCFIPSIKKEPGTSEKRFGEESTLPGATSPNPNTLSLFPLSQLLPVGKYYHFVIIKKNFCILTFFNSWLIISLPIF
jgi:hypothetical protein